jgi:hypothetical protein
MTTFRLSRIIAATVGWGSLGFYRGLNAYDYKYEQNKKMGRRELYLYSGKFAGGLFGCFFYLNPFLSIIMIPKEIYRLEVNLRGMEYEKTTDRYNEL